jgi:hypothetical protein
MGNRAPFVKQLNKPEVKNEVRTNFVTPKGTELPLLNMRGKEYLEVKYRIVWFREEHPDWSIETEYVQVTEASAFAKAIIRTEEGRVVTTSHKFEDRKGFPDFIEKAETGAIGRALALIGYGTQFCADDLNEGHRIVDAPASPVTHTEQTPDKKNITSMFNPSEALTDIVSNQSAPAPDAAKNSPPERLVTMPELQALKSACEMKGIKPGRVTEYLKKKFNKSRWEDMSFSEYQHVRERMTGATATTEAH